MATAESRCSMMFESDRPDSAFCRVCGRRLRSVASRARGVGPVCRGRCQERRVADLKELPREPDLPGQLHLFDEEESA